MSRSCVVLVFVALALPQPAWTQDAVQQGQQVYASQKCSMCHSVAGKGNTKGSLDGVGARWKADELRDWIVNWKAMAAKHQATRKPPMKDYAGLPKAEVDALVAYLLTLK